MSMREDIWWAEDCPEGKRHERIFPYVQALADDQHDERERAAQNACLYDPYTRQLGPDGYVEEPFEDTDPSPITTNIVKSVVDTATAKVAKTRPRAVYTTVGAAWSVQRKAKKLERWTDGAFHRTKIYRKAPIVFRDAELGGLGALKIFCEDGRAQCERTMPDELLWDPEETRAAPPRQLHQRKWINADVLIGMFPEYEAEILKALDERAPTQGYRRTRNRQLLVIESWHLPSGAKAKDGRHTWSISTATLLDEPYRRRWFPFVFYRWCDPVTGFRGIPLVQELVGPQLRVNRLHRFVQRCQDLMSVPRIFVSQIDAQLKTKLTTEVGQVIPMRGNKPPFVMQVQAVGADVYAEIERQIERAYAMTGVSQSSAAGRKEPGIDSGVGQREVNEKETERFSIQSIQWEDFFCDAAAMMVAIQKEEGDDDIEEKWLGPRGRGERLKFSDVDLDADVYEIQIRAASLLSLSPAARKQTVLEWSQAGWITADQAKKLMDHPDLESELSLMTAAIEDIDATAEELLDGLYSPPEPYQDLIHGIPRMQQVFLRARRDGAPPEILDNVDTWIQSAKHEMDEMAKAMAMQQGAGVPPPMPGGPAPAVTPAPPV